jgi:hypothetical protein
VYIRVVQMKPVHLFGHPLKKAPNDHRFGLDEDIRAVLVQWYQQQPKEFFADGIHHLVLLWVACPSPMVATFSSVYFSRTVPKQVSFEQLVMYYFPFIGC